VTPPLVRTMSAAVVASGPGWVVIDKPPGLPVHPGPRGGDNVEARLPAWLGPQCAIHQPVHRLDRDTSGCLLVATRRAALRRLAAAFAARQVGKVYVAILDNVPASAQGQVRAPLRKVSSQADGWRVVIDEAGATAVTDWTVLARRNGQALVGLLPRTGRTHQLRVHAGRIATGATIVGDKIYGAGSTDGLMLHALALAFPEPGQAGSDGIIVAQSSWPARFAQAGFVADGDVSAGLQPLLRSAASIASAIADGLTG